jgi:hypothetical protein
MIFRCCLKWISSNFFANNADSSVVAAIEIVSADLSELRLTVMKFIFDCSFIVKIVEGENKSKNKKKNESYLIQIIRKYF